MMFLRAFHAEWLKRKRSSASALVIAGSLFTPAVIAFVRLLHYKVLPKIYAADSFWPNLWRASWESMAVFFLPLGAILATSLITQLEYKSNAWKQVHALPVSTAVIFLSKLAVIVVMLVQFLLLFTAGIYVSGMLPALIITNVPYPRGSFLSLPLWRENALYFAATLPIVAAQYLVALRTANFLVPIGIGFMAWVGALAAVRSPFAIWWPYSFTTLHYLKGTSLHWVATAAFLGISAVSYGLFLTKSTRG